ncbi:hypothetical protein KIN20_035293 [Parelaphostrongylus tenuis]|uniref:Uncharacterized protein n=1 Tax=Parelaphostrongylus tenuis TaxID=148309 RepID=A0AAD5RBC2_PARTN|nr:hypothetical protein KIN20_035293 [Parelaphostrongylus tenuis]
MVMLLEIDGILMIIALQLETTSIDEERKLLTIATKRREYAEEFDEKQIWYQLGCVFHQFNQAGLKSVL